MLRPKQGVGGMGNTQTVVLRWHRLACAAFLVVYALPGVTVRGAESGPYDKMKADLSKVVAPISEEVVDRYGRLESYVTRGSCACSFHVCGDLFPPTPCLKTDTPEELSCGGNFSLCGHMLVNPDLSGIRTPGNVINRDPVLTSEVVTDICVTKGLEDTFKKASNYTKGFAPWIYFASVRSGVIRIWPLKPRDRGGDHGGFCETYDPRLRPWYKVASSKPKNVIIVVETSRKQGWSFRLHSGDGQRRTRWDVARDAIDKFLGTLDVNDNVNVITYNSNPQILRGEVLMQANGDIIDLLQHDLDNILLGNSSDPARAFNAAFDLFEISFKQTRVKDIDHPVYPKCQNIILFIGDGTVCTLPNQEDCLLHEPNAESQQIEGPVERNLKHIEARQKVFEKLYNRVAIFTLTMHGDDESFARQIACRNGGAWSQLTGGGEPLNEMSEYFQYIAFSMEHLSEESDQMIMSPLYEDASGLGTVATALYPVFVSPRCANGTSSTKKLLLGVVGKDVILSTFITYGLTRLQATNAIEDDLHRHRECNGDYNYPHCKMQVLRGEGGECPKYYNSFSDPEKCYRFQNQTYFLDTAQTDFLNAKNKCKDMGGHLAEINALRPDDKHFLATIVPPDGAWVGLQRTEGKWRWIESKKEAHGLEEGLWLTAPTREGSCVSGFIDPRSTHNNVGGSRCHEQKAFVCEFNSTITAPPPVCQGNWKEVSAEELNDATAGGCLNTDTCDKIDEVKLPSGFQEDVVCKLREPMAAQKTYAELVCCSEDDLERVCVNLQAGNDSEPDTPLNTVAGIVASQNQGSAKSSTSLRSALIASLSVTGALIIAIVLGMALEIRERGTVGAVLSKCCWRYSRYSFHNHITSPGGASRGRAEEAVVDLDESLDKAAGKLARSNEETSSTIPTGYLAAPNLVGQSTGSVPETPPTSSGGYSGITLPLRSPFDVFPNERQVSLIYDIKVTALVNGWQAQGAFGIVREGVWCDEYNRAHKVAIKSAKELTSQRGLEAIRQEFNILSKIPYHPNIVWVIGGRLGDDPIIVEELMSMNLHDVLHGSGRFSQGLTYEQILKISTDVVAGLDHLHEHNVIHYDIKPANILLDEDLTAKLADFTCSKLKLESNITASTRGTPGYIPPECLISAISRACMNPLDLSKEAKRYQFCAEKIDVYGVGMVMLECVTGQLDQASDRGRELCPKPLWDLIARCTSYDPEVRPKCKQMKLIIEGMMGHEWTRQRPKEDVWRVCDACSDGVNVHE